MKKILFLLIAGGFAFTAVAQVSGTPGGNPAKDAQAAKNAELIRQKAEANRLAALKKSQAALDEKWEQATTDGVNVSIQTIAHYRGMRTFQLSGIGLVIGLEGTGDTTKSVVTQTLYSNYFKSRGLTVPAATVAAKNVALVQVTANMPAYTKPGTKIDVTVSSIGDASSLQGGFLILTPLYDATDPSTVIATAQGALSIGGFNASGSGSSVQKNAVNVGRIPSGSEVQTRIDSQVVFQSNSKQVLYLDLEQANPTTMSRVVAKLKEKYPDLDATSIDNTTVQISIPQGADPADVMSEVDQTNVFADIPATVVINERTGTIVVGGNVRLGPAMIVSGSLNVRIDTANDVSQPGPFSTGTTTPVQNSQVTAGQEKAKVALLPPTTTVADLARIFQALELKPNDVIQILQLLKQQGALKARIELQ